MTIMTSALEIARIPKRADNTPKKDDNGSFHWGTRPVLIESRILRTLGTVKERPVIIPNHLVPGCMKQNRHTRVKGSRGLVVLGAETFETR